MLTEADVACWLLKSSGRPAELPDGPAAGAVVLSRCLRRSYRLGLLRVGQPCVLWVSGRVDPGVAAVGRIASHVREEGGGPAVDVELTALADVVPRAELLLDPAVGSAEVLRMPAGSNPSHLRPREWAALSRRL
ncbi:hypothetical protein AB1207_04055 [Kineococcus endophyticus]|uniref:EVE domain-containing protein n=1 Tax=Kineococcus endophyticus TaxID=1181883 RepID=A0ABV3P308_9ACTN